MHLTCTISECWLCCAAWKLKSQGLWCVVWWGDLIWSGCLVWRWWSVLMVGFGGRVWRWSVVIFRSGGLSWGQIWWNSFMAQCEGLSVGLVWDLKLKKKSEVLLVKWLQQNLNSHLLPLFISYRSSGEKLIKYQAISCVIMSVILMTTLFYKALILQGEIWCWSLLMLKGLINPKIKIWILICCPCSFPTEVVGRSWLNIKQIHPAWSRPQFPWPICFSKHWYYEEKFDADHS